VVRSLSLNFAGRFSLVLCAALLGLVTAGPALATSPALAATPTAESAPGLTKFIGLKTSRRAVAVTLGCTGSGTQTCSGTLVLNEAASLNKQKVIGVTSSTPESNPLKLGESTFGLTGGSTATVTVKLDATGVSLLHRLHTLSTVVLGSEAMPNNSAFLFLFHDALFVEPKHSAHKHRHKRRGH
jgi:hypothetical protein